MIQNSLKIFFWRIAGSDIEVLKKCKRDHSKHVQIGLMIFMTTVFAGFAGGLAGYEIGGQSLPAGLVFGVLWAFLIFSIDRTMVVTLQKNPQKSFWSIFFPASVRIILAAIISFIISIPLEIQVFSETISVKMEESNMEKLKQKKDFIQEIGMFESKVSDLEDAGDEEQLRDSLINGPCISEECNASKAKIQNLNSQIKSKRKERDAQYRIAGRVKKTVPTITLKWDENGNPEKRGPDENSSQWKKYKNENFKGYKLNKAYKKLNSDLKKETSSLVRLENDYKAEQRRFKEDAISLKDRLKNEIGVINDSVEFSTNNLNEKLGNSTGFLRQYEAMTEAVEENPQLEFFLWLIRALFFIIEILPTVSKMMTPASDYEARLNKRSEKFMEEFEEEYEESKNLTKIQQEKETKLNTEILENITKVQSELAEEMIKYWKKEQLDNIKKTNASSFKD